MKSTFVVPLRCRFANLKKPSIYQDAVLKLFTGVRKELEDSPPSRQRYMKLIKSLVDFVVATSSKKGQSEKVTGGKEEANASS